MSFSEEEKKSISWGQAIINQWKNIFNYKDLATKEEYWKVLATDLIISMIFVLLMQGGMAVVKAGNNEVGYALLIFGIIAGIFLAVSMIPLCSLTVRRLHDTGRADGGCVLC